jgi:hypothetical protein
MNETRINGHTMADLWSDLYQTWARTGFYPWHAAWDYSVDAWQRTVLFWDGSDVVQLSWILDLVLRLAEDEAHRLP